MHVRVNDQKVKISVIKKRERALYRCVLSLSYVGKVKTRAKSDEIE